MEKLELGQTVTIVRNEAAKDFAVDTFAGHVFVVSILSPGGCAVTEIEGFEWNVPPEACELLNGNTGAVSGKQTAFQRVAEMNEAFGNPKGNPEAIDWERITKQCMNIGDEFVELVVALGADAKGVKALKTALGKLDFTGKVDLNGVRDALCDIQVFGNGAHHLMGYDADRDMDDVVDGVMTRFIKSPEDKEATIALHAKKGVTDVYFEGNYPKMVMKSASDQPDAPKGKFLKSASCVKTVFRPAP